MNGPRPGPNVRCAERWGSEALVPHPLPTH
jgi:hypothetical protein